MSRRPNRPPPIGPRRPYRRPGAPSAALTVRTDPRSPWHGGCVRSVVPRPDTPLPGGPFPHRSRPMTRVDIIHGPHGRRLSSGVELRAEGWAAYRVSGRRRARRSISCSTPIAAIPSRWRATATGSSRARIERPRAPAIATGSASMATACAPIRCRASSPKARTARRAVVDPGELRLDRCRLARRRARRGRCSTRCTSAPSRPKGTWAAAAAQLPALADARRHDRSR